MSTTFARILTIAPSNSALTDPIKGVLIDAWGTLPASEIGQKTIVDLAEELSVILPVSDYDVDTRFAVAEAVHSLLVRLGFAAQAQPAQQIKVTFDKRPADMDLRELLEALAASPAEYLRFRPYIEALPEVIKATEVAKGLWVITTTDGKLDVNRTLGYVARLNRLFAVPQRTVDDRRPITLARAMGAEERPMIHPFTGRPVQGPDENGFDLSLLSDELHEALLWAAVTGHSAWPGQMDVYTYTDEVFRTPLPRRWQRILEDYRHAKSSQNPTIRLITRHWPVDLSLEAAIDLAEQLLGGDSRGPRSNDNAGPEQAVRNVARLAGTLRIQGSGNTIDGGVYERLSLQGSGNDFINPIFVDGGNLTGAGNSGTVLLPPGVRLRIIGSGNSVRQVNMEWSDLKERMRSAR